MAVRDEEYLNKMQKVVYTEQAKDIFSLIYNYKEELETENKIGELEKVKELEEYLRNNEKGLQRYQYKLGYKEEELEGIKEELPSLGSEESHMYCICRDRMKKKQNKLEHSRSRSTIKSNNEQNEWNNNGNNNKQSREENKKKNWQVGYQNQKSKETERKQNSI